MKAIVYTKYGPPDVLHLAEIDNPVPNNKEILVKVHATTVSTATLWARRGNHPESKFFTFAVRIMFGLTKPRKKILGYEFSGEVEATGKDVKLFKPGDQVFGTTTGLKFGAYAEYVCLPEEWKQGVVALKPANMTYEQAAAIPVGGMTALYILNKANIQKEQKVLIYGASGCVGTYAVQIAKFFGARVTGVCSGANIELVKSLGADHVIDYSCEDFTRNGETYDVIFDAVSKISRSQSKQSLSKKGTYLTVNSPTSERTKNLEYIRNLVEDSKIAPVIDKIYSLEQTAEAHKYADTGHKKGNVVIQVLEKNKS